MSDSNVRQKINFNFVSNVLGITKDEIIAYPENEFCVYWFLKSNHLTDLILSSDEIQKLDSCNLFKSAALLHSLTKMTSDDLLRLKFNDSFAVLALNRILDMNNCETQNASFANWDADVNWFSIQYGCFSISLPNYLWWYATDAVQKIVGQNDFSLQTTILSGVPIIMLSFCGFDFPESCKQVINFNLINTVDPLLQCADTFLDLGLTDENFTYFDKVTSLYFIMQMYELDGMWKLALLSTLRDNLVRIYSPGETFFETVFRCLQFDISKFSAGINCQAINNKLLWNGKQFNLIDYVKNPSGFINNLKGGL